LTQTYCGNLKVKKSLVACLQLQCNPNLITSSRPVGYDWAMYLFVIVEFDSTPKTLDNLLSQTKV